MINIINTIRLNAPISSIHVSNDTIYILDDNYIISAFSLENFSSIYKHLLVADGENKHLYDKSYSLSSDFNAYVSDNSQNNGILYKFSDEKFIELANLNFNENSISVSSFSNNSQYLAIGDEDGKAYFYDLSIEKLLFSLDPRADSISSISFSKNSKLTCIASFDKSIILYNIDNHKTIAELHTSDVVESSIFIQADEKLAAITRDKKLLTYDIKEKELSYAEFEFEEWPTTILEIGHKHILVGTRGNSLYLINTETLDLVKEIPSDKIGVKTLVIKGENLYIGYIDGSIDIVNTLHTYKEFELHLDLTNFAEATELIEENIFLLTTKAVKKYDTMWDQILDLAKGHLIKKDLQKSVDLVKPFFFDKKKEAEYILLNSNKKDIETFVQLVDSEKTILAFKYADANEYLKNTKEYDIIEKKWQKVYQTCKAMLEKDDPESTQKAISTLTRYSAIKSKADNVNNLIKNHKDYARAQTLVKARNFRLYFILAEKKPYLTLEGLYQKVVQLGQQTYTKLLDLENSGDYEKAEALGKYLLDFTDFKVKATQSMESIEVKKNLEELIEANDTDEIYSTIERHGNLETFKAFIDYHKIFEGKKQVATEAAKDGDTPTVHNELNEYLNINNLKSTISFVFKLSYLSELQNAAIAEFELIDWANSIEKYVKVYGSDSEILAFAKSYALTHILVSLDCDDEKIDTEKMEFYDTILVR